MLLNVAYTRKGLRYNLPVYLYIPQGHREWYETEAVRQEFMTELKKRLVILSLRTSAGTISSSKTSKEDDDQQLLYSCSQFKLVCSQIPPKLPHILHLHTISTTTGAAETADSQFEALRGSQSELCAWIYPPNVDFPHELLLKI
jgi:hypothetical protein